MAPDRHQYANRSSIFILTITISLKMFGIILLRVGKSAQAIPHVFNSAASEPRGQEHLPDTRFRPADIRRNPTVHPVRVFPLIGPVNGNRFHLIAALEEARRVRSDGRPLELSAISREVFRQTFRLSWEYQNAMLFAELPFDD